MPEYIPEDVARFIEDRLSNLVERTLVTNLQGGPPKAADGSNMLTQLLYSPGPDNSTLLRLNTQQFKENGLDDPSRTEYWVRGVLGRSEANSQVTLHLRRTAGTRLVAYDRASKVPSQNNPVGGLAVRVRAGAPNAASGFSIINNASGTYGIGSSSAVEIPGLRGDWVSTATPTYTQGDFDLEKFLASTVRIDLFDSGTGKAYHVMGQLSRLSDAQEGQARVRLRAMAYNWVLDPATNLYQAKLVGGSVVVDFTADYLRHGRTAQLQTIKMDLNQQETNFAGSAGVGIFHVFDPASADPTLRRYSWNSVATGAVQWRHPSGLGQTTYTVDARILARGVNGRLDGSAGIIGR